MSDTDEEFVPEEEAENPGNAIKKLRERLSAAEKEKQENLEGWQRARADLANFKKDQGVERERTGERLRASFAEDLIPVLDGFEMAFKSPSFSSASAEWKKGIESLYNQLVSALKNFGVEQMKKAEGELFDPKYHEAVHEVPVDAEEKDHTVVSVLRSGYTLGDFVIRPAQVTIGVYSNK